MRTARALGLVSCLAASTLLTACTIDTESPDDARARKLRPHVESYLSATDLADATAEGDPYLEGRLVPIDVNARDVALGMFTWIPAELRAQSHEDVGTVVWLEWGEEAGASYEGEGRTVGGVVATCNVTVIDHAARKIVARVKIVGDQSATVHLSRDGVEAGGEVVGERPVQKVVDYLTALPRR